MPASRSEASDDSDWAKGLRTTWWERVRWWADWKYDRLLTVVADYRRRRRWAKGFCPVVIGFQRPEHLTDWHRDPSVWHRQAEHFHRAARLQYEEEPNPPALFPPTYFLIGHGIEVVLKAYLLSRGYPLEPSDRTLGSNLAALTTLGHDLDKLAAEARAAQLCVTLSDFGWQAISRLNVLHKDHFTRYPSDHARFELPDPRSLLEDLGRLVEATRGIAQPAIRARQTPAGQ